MVNRPSVPEIITVNSESLQAQIRDLLPSQNGFGSELQATNVITPIIDLTGAAEGVGLRTDLQTALAFGSQTAFQTENTSTVLANSPGFYRVIGLATFSAAGATMTLSLSDGFSTKIAWSYIANGTNTDNAPFDYVFWLASGESLTATSDVAGARISG